MLALRLHGPRDARLDEIPEPAVRPGTVKVRVTCAGICGSDLSLYDTAPVPVDWPHPLIGEVGPHVLGHEISGYVAEVGEGVEGILVDALVAIQPNLDDGECPACLRGEPNLCEQGGFLGVNGGGGGFAEYVVAPAAKVFLMPPEIGPETAALIEPLSVALHAVRRSGIAAGQTALIIGGGPIGLGLLLCLRAHGVDRVIVSEVSASRRALAESFGADVIDPRSLDPVAHARKVTGGRGVDASFDAAGVGTATFAPAVEALRKGGTTVAVAMYHEAVDLDPGMLMVTEKTCTGSLAYTSDDFRAVIDAITEGRIDPTRLVTRRISLDEVLDKGIELLRGEGRDTEVKILVTR
ncbi:2,3-butanediol dehydrogenase [Nocardia sp. NPDC059180]|uniref:2,3-butanediol dehydrogenase n=1 Tax=Nocardia sp. NPDC059180 TaxID=3346761 RepID=UPI003694B40F